MLESKIYNDGDLVVGKISGVIDLQNIMDGIFLQIDCRNVGEVKEGFSQLHFDTDVERVILTEEDIAGIAEIDSGIGVNLGRSRTALVLNHPDIIRLAKLHRSLAIEKGYEVEIFTCLKEGFAWLGFENPEPDIIKQ